MATADREQLPTSQDRTSGGDRAGILAAIDSKTKVLALIALIAEALFLGALAKLPEDQIVWALTVCALVLVVTIAGITTVEVMEARRATTAVSEVKPSPKTPDSEILNELVNSALQAVCRAVSIPNTPEKAALRVFIFRVDGDELICSHYWAPNPVKELVSRLRFPITRDTAERVAVVRAVLDKEIARTPVEPLPDEVGAASGEVSDELTFVLAAPLFRPDGTVWGTVDFDASNARGMELLSTDFSDAAMYQLAQHLQGILSLEAEARAS